MTGALPFPRPQLRQIDRLCRLAYLRTLRDLRRSAAAGRPISLPNLLRLHCRRRAAWGLETGVREAACLREFYWRHQPFRVQHNR